MIESYGPRERIRKKKDFTNLYKKGSCARGKYFNLIFLPNNLSHSRMAAVTSRKVGNAVQRNKIRRRARELFRRNKDLLTLPLDILFIAKKDIQTATWQDMRERCLSALRAISGKPWSHETRLIIFDQSVQENHIAFSRDALPLLSDLFRIHVPGCWKIRVGQRIPARTEKAA